MAPVLIVGGSAADRSRAARAQIPADHTIVRLDARTLPFTRVDAVVFPPAPRTVLIEGISAAFPDCQQGGTRLVLTQSTYLVQKWIDRLDEGDRIVATADRAALERGAPEAFQRRGPWQHFGLINTEGTEDTKDVLESQPFGCIVSLVLNRPAPKLLAQAFSASDPAERLRLCREAAALDPECEVAQLALASASRETRDGDAARAALDRAAAIAPQWEAIHYERGKLSLVYDDLAQARDAFQRAADVMPTFSAAFSNLGATLGELGDPAAALQAFRQALAHDPRSFAILNNIGVVSRELGRLDESEAALRRVVAIDPGFVFGHYNLGHTLFLAGRYADAIAAYEDGRRCDPQQNPRQGCRLAIVRFAAGDTAGAERDLWRCVNAAPAEEREDLLLEAYEIAQAVITQQPALGAERAFVDRIGAEIIKSE
ncbi:MAG: Tetratricopeptide 2 repeat protein [Acidobacteria bacterium]|nr:Tetratricopeptide 2 repeat protein [Acidobacteriota bacterium]